MAPDQRTFVRAALKQLGLTPTQLGNRLGKDNGYSAVNSWTTEQPKNYRRLSFDDAMRIAEFCGWLNMRADAVAEAHDPAPLPSDPQAAMLVLLGAILHNQAEALPLLGVPEARIEQPQLVEEQRSRTARRRRP